jgi:pyrimidine and pyridine-specific 5'-nucleotidase
MGLFVIQPYIFSLQIFTNSDKAHAAQVLRKLGLEECFEGVICFETLNEVEKTISNTRILCKPNLEAMEAAIQIAKIDPNKTVSLCS